MGRQFYKIKISNWGFGEKKDFAKHLTEKVFTFMKPDCRILEIGAGLGHFSDECKKKRFNYIAIEPSEEMAQSLAAKGHHVISDTVPPISLENNSFDFVIANHVLEHQPNHIDAMDFLLEIKRVLRPGGYCCISFPNWLKMKNIFYEMDYSHNFLTTRYRVTQMLKATGMAIERIYYTNGQIKLRKGFISWIIRSPSMFLQTIVNTNLLSIVAEYLNIEEFLCRVRKTVHESIYMIIRKE